MATSATFDHNRKGIVRRALKKREPKIVEDSKLTMIVKGQKTSLAVKEALADLAKLKAPNVMKYSKRNPIRPFDDASALEFFAERSDASLFAFGSHSAKRPNNLIFGRFFNYRMLDMVEFGIENFQSMQSFKEPKQNLGSRTCIIFQGEEFDNDSTYKEISNILLDFFADRPTDLVNLACLDHVIVFTSQPKKILMRHYTTILKKSGSRIPRVELAEIGPSMDLVLRRQRFASGDLKTMANTHHVVKKSKSKKNIGRDDLYQQIGNIHIGSQNMHEMRQKLPKSLRNSKKHNRDEPTADGGANAKKQKANADE